MSGNFNVLSIWKPHFQCSANWKVPKTCPCFCNEPHLLHIFFCECCTWHHLHILVKASLCCDWKGRAVSAQSFPLLHLATMKIPRRDHFISACSHHMGVVHHAHPISGESQLQHSVNWEAATLAPRLG